VFYLGFKVYPLYCVLATQARVCGPGRTGRTEPRGSGRADPNTNTSYGFINIFLYFKTLISKKSIIMSLKLRFLLYGFSRETECYSMLDIRAKCNILFTEIAKNLSYVIYSVNTFIMFIVIRD